MAFAKLGRNIRQARGGIDGLFRTVRLMRVDSFSHRLHMTGMTGSGEQRRSIVRKRDYCDLQGEALGRAGGEEARPCLNHLCDPGNGSKFGRKHRRRRAANHHCDVLHNFSLTSQISCEIGPLDTRQIAHGS